MGFLQVVKMVKSSEKSIIYDDFFLTIAAHHEQNHWLDVKINRSKGM